MYVCRVQDRVPRRRKRKAHSQEAQTIRVAMSQLDLHALISEVLRGLEDLRFTSWRALWEMLAVWASACRIANVRNGIRMIATESAGGEPRSRAANEVHGDSSAGSTPCNGRVETATTVHTVACDVHRNNRRGRQLFREWHDEVGIVKSWHGQWEPVSGRSGCLEKRCFADLVKSRVFETSLSGQQICCVSVCMSVCVCVCM